jgi:hypothetical protein
MVISSTVLRPSRRTPSSSPLFSMNLQKREIVGGGRDEAAAAGVHLARREVAALGRIVDQLSLPPLRRRRSWRRSGRACPSGTWKSVSTMPSGSITCSAQVLLERLARDHLDQIAQHVGRDRVVPGLAGLGDQRQLRQPFDHLLQAGVGRLEIDAVLFGAIGGVDRRCSP